VLLAVSAATNRIVVGPVRHGLGEPIYRQEQPPASGPVAGIAAAMELIEQPLVAVLAADLPFIGRGLNELRSAMMNEGNDAAVFVDTTGRVNYLASVWRAPALRAALARIGEPAGVPVRALYEAVTTAHIPDFDAVGADVDTPDDLAAAEQRLWAPSDQFTLRSGEQPPPTPLAWPGLELHTPS
jgi:molybdopterin-guanine dinucleotide biosynthesis protein A